MSRLFPLTTTIDCEVTMDSRKFVFKETGIIAIGQVVCVGAMFAVFGLLKRFDMAVLWGGLVGGMIAIANYFLMSLFANMAADKAEKQDVAGGQKLIQLSYMGRMIGMLVALIICAKCGVFNLIALVIPLAFNRPILTVAELVRKKGGKNL